VRNISILNNEIRVANFDKENKKLETRTFQIFLNIVKKSDDEISVA